MTRDEAIRPFSMLHANWPFLDFTNPTVAEIWMNALAPYHEAEVRQGITDAIANITKTPTVAEVLEFVRAVHDGTRRAEAEARRNLYDDETPDCRKCNDHGFINIIYPSGTEAVRPCTCQAAGRQFGPEALKYTQQPMPKWKIAALFGENEIPSQYKLVRVSRIIVPSGETYTDSNGNTHQRMAPAYGPYFPKNAKEEVFMQYQKEARR